MEGFLEKRVDGLWTKYWCSLKNGCLCFYVTPNDQISADSTDLTGYKIEQLVDRFQGKRFVIQLTHDDYVDILLSMDSRDELEVWHQCLTDILTSKAKRHQDKSSRNSPETGTKLTDEIKPTPSVQNVKHKLLAEMLRQKMELQKIRASRNGTRTWSNPDQERDGSSPSSPSPVGSSEDRVRTLTRLRQRRMSTQIKMTAIQKQMEETSGSSRDKKVVFHLVRRRPDLVQSHSVDQSRQTDLEEQFKRLSSRLQEIDTSISSHGVTSPRDEVTKNTLRHSCDSSLLKMAINHGTRDCHTPRNTEEEVTADTKKKTHAQQEKDKNKEKDKDVVRSNSIKSSMQRFAHKTFARAHWSRIKKSALNKTPINNNDNNTINANDNSDYDNNNISSEKPPDVIDVTNNNHHKGSDFSSHESTIFAPPDSFRTDDSISNDSSPSPRKHRTPKERILSKLSASHSFTQIDKIASRFRSSSTSPSLFKILSKHDSQKKDRDHTSSPQYPASDTFSSVPKLNLNFEGDDTDSLPVSVSNRSQDSTPTSNRRTNGNSHHSFYSVRGNDEVLENGSQSARSENVRARSGFYSARNERASPNPNRNSWSYGGMASYKREVNPHAMAEIKAFEELSSKFLGIKGDH